MKKGDKILCTKNYNIENNTVLYKKNNIYTITDIIEDSNGINNRYIIDNYLSFYIKHQISDWCFDDYFISLKEERKLKLDKINECRR